MTLTTHAPGIEARRPSAPAIIEQLLRDRPVFHAGGTRQWNALPDTLALLAEHLHPGARTIETGAGASTLVFGSEAGVHVAISPLGDEHRRISRYATQSGMDLSAVRFVCARSDDALPALVAKGQRFSLAFVDGKHSFPHPIVDCHYMERLLEPGGVLVIDDVPIPAVGVVFRFLSSSPDWELLAIADDRAAAFRKLADAEEDDNWRPQPFNRRYPDHSFAPVGRRIVLGAQEAGAALRRSAARGLRAIDRSRR